jgi:hypothetical protein
MFAILSVEMISKGCVCADINVFIRHICVGRLERQRERDDLALDR